MAETIMIFEKTLIDPTALLQNTVTDFDIMRSDPVIFRAGDGVVVCSPVNYFNHYDFLADLLGIIEQHVELFDKMEFLSMAEFRDKSVLAEALKKVNLFSATQEYKLLTRKHLPDFISKWGKTIRTNYFTGRQKIVDIKSRRRVRKILKDFTADDLLHIFFVMFIFNYDVVKKNLFDLCTRIRNPGTSDSQTGTISNCSMPNNVVQMPKYSEKPFSKETLQTFENQRKL